MSSLPFEATIFRKYVDEIFMAIPWGTEQSVLAVFNSIEPRIQFTKEPEQNNRLSSLLNDLRKTSAVLKDTPRGFKEAPDGLKEFSGVSVGFRKAQQQFWGLGSFLAF